MNRPIFRHSRSETQFSKVNRSIALNLDLMCVCPCIHIETGLYCKFQYFCYPLNVWSKDGTDTDNQFNSPFRREKPGSTEQDLNSQSSDHESSLLPLSHKAWYIPSKRITMHYNLKNQ